MARAFKWCDATVAAYRWEIGGEYCYRAFLEPAHLGMRARIDRTD
jgi:hypothetical protein